MTCPSLQKVAPIQYTPQARSDRIARPISVGKILCFCFLHVLLALLMVRYPNVGRVHAWATLLVGVTWALQGAGPARLLKIFAYIAGSEVLWRMTRTPIFWEYAKYAVVATLLVAIQQTKPLRATRFPLVYFGLLVPSIVLTVIDCGRPEKIRELISFNLSGPLALAVCAAYCSRIRVTPAHIQRMLISYLLPVVGIVTLILFHLAQAETIQFGTESSKLSSGGFGPNQVSSVLGFGSLAAFFLAVLFPVSTSPGARLVVLALALWLGAQSALTLSRSGLYLAALSVVAAIWFGFREARVKRRLLLTVALLFVGGAYVVAPQLDKFTGGAVSRRFADTGLTGRDRLAQVDLVVWQNHFLLGVGPGMAAKYRAQYYRAAAAHTELTRLLAEHGVLGAIALAMLPMTAWQALRSTRTHRWKAFMAAMIAYTLLFMLVNAMRIVLPSLAFGLIFARYQHE